MAMGRDGKDGWRDGGGEEEEEEAVGCHVQPAAAAGAHGNKMEITAGSSLSETTLILSYLILSYLILKYKTSSGLRLVNVKHRHEQRSVARRSSHL